jgi:DNA-binding MarR family transcriptional regulator
MTAERGAGGPAWSDHFEDIIRKVAGRTNAERDVDTMVAVMQIVRAANRISQDVDANVHRPLGFSIAGFRVMSAVFMDGPAEPARLARLAGVSPASISSVLNTLEKDGFVTRERRSTDRRVVTVSLTAAGEAACHTATERQLDIERAWLEPLSAKEVQQLLRLLRKVLAGRPHPADHPPQETP